MKDIIQPVRHGLLLGILALIAGALWAAYVATHHEKLHGGFEAEVAAQQQAAVEMSMDSMDMGHSHGGAVLVNHHDEAASGGHAHDSGQTGHGANAQHSHSGSLANDAMQRLLRGHIHAMGLGVLVCVLLIIVAFTSLKEGWKKVLAWSFGLGAVLYPPAWVIMGFRTVELGPEAAEASIMWLFSPAVGLLIGSMVALFGVLLIEQLNLKGNKLFSWVFV